MKRVLLVLLLVLMTGMSWAGEKKPGAPVIRPLGRQLDDAGCVYFERNAGLDAFPIFISSFDGVWMNIDGLERQLSQDDHYERKNVTKYTTGDDSDYEVYLFDRTVKHLDAGDGYGKATMIIQNLGQDQKVRKRVIKVKGGCGC